MAKRKTTESKTRRGASEAARTESSARKSARAESDAEKNDAPWFSPAAMRETVESVIIAFVLAFLFRTFEAEAFVIPTGSMAPTLMGKHKDLECPICHYRYQVSASDHPDREHPDNEVEATVYHSTCPMCRFTMAVDPPIENPPKKKPYPSYEGDRILVAKFPYDLANPKRWDVIVFKYPGNATMNYIKRLVGLPGETIRIHDGDLWIHEPGQPKDRFEIARKPPEKILAMLQPVFDNDLAPAITGALHWPARWAPEPVPLGKGNAWTSKDLSSFEIDAGAKGESWIRYRHRVPTPEQWQSIADTAGVGNRWDLTRDASIQVLGAKPPDPDSVPPQLISDFTAYNTGYGGQGDGTAEGLIERGYGLHWVGDLAVQFELESKSASGKVVAELIKGGRHFQCRFDLASGKAELAIGGDGPEAERYHRTGATAVVGPGRHTILFANIDDELNLWVGPPQDAWWRQARMKLVPFKDPAKPDAPPEEHPNRYQSALLDDHIPTPADLTPVGISAEGASVKVDHIKVLRDIYYIAVFNHGKDIRQSPLKDYVRFNPDLRDPRTWKEGFKDYVEFDQDLKDPRNWDKAAQGGENGNMRTVDIQLEAADRAHPGKDRFFVLGDNSGQSSDGRLWVGDYWVDRKLLIGKALFIYWPHGWEIPYLPLPVNPVPYWQRMHLVR